MKLVLGILFCSVSVTSAAEPTEENWTSLAGEAWEEYLSKLVAIEGTGEFETFATSEGKEINRTKILQTFALQGKYRRFDTLFETDRHWPKGSRSIAVENPEYLFELGKKPETTEWSLEKIQADHKRDFHYPLETVFRIMGNFLPDTIKAASFKTSSIKIVQQNDIDLAEVQFTYLAEDPRNKILRGGVIRFHWKEYWLPHNGELDVTYVRYDNKLQKYFPLERGTLLLKCEYQKGIIDVPVLARQTYEIDAYNVDNPEKKTSAHFKRVYSSTPAGRVDPSEFRLTHYGIPEPANLQKSNWALFWVYTVLAVIGLLLIGFACIPRSKKKI